MSCKVKQKLELSLRIITNGKLTRTKQVVWGNIKEVSVSSSLCHVLLFASLGFIRLSKIMGFADLVKVQSKNRMNHCHKLRNHKVEKRELMLIKPNRQ